MGGHLQNHYFYFEVLIDSLQISGEHDGNAFKKLFISRLLGIAGQFSNRNKAVVMLITSSYVKAIDRTGTVEVNLITTEQLMIFL